MLWQKQEENIPLFGYGSKTYLIGMTDAALDLCGGHMPDNIYYGIKQIITELAFHELEMIDGVVETLEALQGHYNLIVATHWNTLISVVKIIVVICKSYRKSFDDKGR